MTRSSQETAAQLVTASLLQLLAILADDEAAAALTDDTKNTLCQLIAALPGKTDPAVCTCLQEAAALGQRLDQVGKNDAQKRFYSVQPLRQYYETQSFSQFIADTLLRALTSTPRPELAALAFNLFEEYGDGYLQALFTAKLLIEPAAECYSWAAQLLEKKLFSKKKHTAKQSERIDQILSAIYWQEDRQKFVLRTWHNDPRSNVAAVVCTDLHEPLDERFYDLLMDRQEDDLDRVLSQWVQPQNKILCQKLGLYFYQQALRKEASYAYLDYLRQCRWTDCTDLLIRYYQHNKGINLWFLLRFINEMPGTSQAKAQEVQRLYDAVSQGQLPQHTLSQKEAFLEALQNSIFELRRGAPVTEN